MINKRWITLPVVHSRPFTSKAVFWAILKEFKFAVDCSYIRRTREESLFWKGSSAGVIFPPIASLRFQTSQHKGQKIHDSSRTFQSKIHPNGPELALEENQNPTVFERLECVARSMRASHKPSRWLPLSDWMMLDNDLFRVGNHRHFSDPSTVYPPDSGRVSWCSSEATYISAHCSHPPMNKQGNRLFYIQIFHSRLIGL